VKQLAIFSYRDGIGKTAITTAFASLADKFVLADCDINSPDLHLIMKADIKKTVGFHGFRIASIDPEKCDKCKKCLEYCRFNAIDEKINILQESCKGCGLCEYVCPMDAIEMMNRDTGFTYSSETRTGPMSHAKLNPGEEISGSFVASVKENAKNIAKDKGKNLVIIDGASGISHTVLSAIIGVDLVLIVSEPCITAVNDLKKINEVINHLKIPTVVCINKNNLNTEVSDQIEEYCNNNQVTLIGKIPYDKGIVEAMAQQKNILDFSNEETSEKIIELWNSVIKKIIK